MRRRFPWAAMFLASILVLSGCATLQEFAALRSVVFSFDRVGEVKVAGIPIGSGSRFTSLARIMHEA